jgi:hypothetical protein
MEWYDFSVFRQEFLRELRLPKSCLNGADDQRFILSPYAVGYRGKVYPTEAR